MILRGCLTIWLAVTISFFLLRLLPGDAIESQLRQGNAISTEAIVAQRAYFGLDAPLTIQYVRYWDNLIQGDLGISLITREPVSHMIQSRLPATIRLATVTLIIAIGVGNIVGIGTLAPQPIGGLCQIIITITLATPIYWSATLMIYMMNRAAWQGILPAAIVLGISVGGGIAQVVSGSLHQTKEESYIQTARAKGLRLDGVFYHQWRASLLPIISVIALQSGFLLSGTVIIEIIFRRQGIGSLLYQSVLNQDYPTVQAIILLSAAVYLAIRLIAQWLAAQIDPRLKAI